MKVLKYLAFFLGVLFFFFNASPVSAENEFSVDSRVKYQVQDNGRTLVIHDITLENNFSTLYATNYTVSLQNIDAQNIRAGDDKGNALQTDVVRDGDLLNIKVAFTDAVVGQGEQRHFSISYENSAL